VATAVENSFKVEKPTKVDQSRESRRLTGQPITTLEDAQQGSDRKTFSNKFMLVQFKSKIDANQGFITAVREKNLILQELMGKIK
jgi:hypothetical protein